ncbi:transketolase family protein [Herbiconiux ginsengi]|uniref:Transketolase subunit B n=1 Tax=Herbiconiux ginsengi TaxID=381665 RepID=A0A1H3TZP1_9MICO|nr:transketolase family protein [Herbiconiux ginsengi]SDZ55680.1 transketolase subunit B [Herbiconiux ginsengi]
MRLADVDTSDFATIRQETIRSGFGKGLLAAGRESDRVVALCADLTESTQMHLFRDAFPDRFIQVGVAEQNLVTVAAGLAHAGFIPFTTSYAAFSPGRNWEQIKTTAALNDQPVKIVGAHTGINVGPDGATHQMLEDIALMRVLPNMVVVAPADSIEAEKATRKIAVNDAPSYLRLARDKTPVFTRPDTPFEIGKALHLQRGNDVTIVATGTMTYEALAAARILSERGINADVLHLATIKPLDEDAILASAALTRRVVTVEEAQIAGGLGGAVAEVLSEHLPTIMMRIGIRDRFGESGGPRELLDHFGLTAPHIARSVSAWLEALPSSGDTQRG